MNRNDKIRLLQDIAAGHKTIAEIMLPIIRIWVQNKTDPSLFHCEAEGLTKRKGESLPGEIIGRELINIFIHRSPD